MRVIIIIYFFITSFFSSCNYSNEIYFDVTNQSIHSCNSKEIRRVYIENDSSTEAYTILWTDSTSIAPKTIDLKYIQSGYNIYKGWNNRRVLSNEFRLSGLSTYTIERVQGDAAASKIKVWTDNVGNINKTSQPTCQ